MKQELSIFLENIISYLETYHSSDESKLDNFIIKLSKKLDLNFSKKELDLIIKKIRSKYVFSYEDLTERECVVNVESGWRMFDILYRICGYKYYPSKKFTSNDSLPWLPNPTSKQIKFFNLNLQNLIDFMGSESIIDEEAKEFIENENGKPLTLYNLCNSKQYPNERTALNIMDSLYKNIGASIPLSDIDENWEYWDYINNFNIEKYKIFDYNRNIVYKYYPGDVEKDSKKYAKMNKIIEGNELFENTELSVEELCNEIMPESEIMAYKIFDYLYNKLNIGIPLYEIDENWVGFNDVEDFDSEKFEIWQTNIATLYKCYPGDVDDIIEMLYLN